MAKYGPKGVLFKRGAATVGQVRTIGGPGMSADSIDVTDVSETYKSFVMDTLDGGEVSLELFFDPQDTQHIGLRQDLENRTKSAYSIVWGLGMGTTTFSGYVTGYEPGAGVGDAQGLSVTLKTDGSVSW